MTHTEVATVASQSTARLDGRFHRLFAASLISNLGDGLFIVALPLVAAELTRDPRQVAGVAVALGLPWLLLALIAGALVDRWDRRRIMVAADLFRSALVAGLAIAVATDNHSMAMLYVVGFLLGTAETMFDNASQTLLPSIIDDPELLERANGRLFTAETITNQFVGPPLGGWLVAVAAFVPFAVDAASFLVASLLVASISIDSGHRQASTAAPSAARASLRTDILEGVRWLVRRPLLRTMAIVLGLMNMAFAAGMSIIVLFAQDILGLGDVGYGMLLTSFAVGSVAGGLGAARLSARFGSARLLVASAATIAASQLLIAPLSNPWLVGGVMAMSGFSAIVWNVVTVSLRQRIIPDELLGRVNSVYRFLGWGSIPVGALAGGLIADGFGLRAPFWVGGSIVLVAVIAASPMFTTARIQQVSPEPKNSGRAS